MPLVAFEQLYLVCVAVLFASVKGKGYIPKPNKCVTNADCASNQWCNNGQCLTFEPKTQLTSYLPSPPKSLPPPPPPPPLPPPGPAPEPCEQCNKPTFEPLPIYGYKYPPFLSFRNFYPAAASPYFMSSAYNRLASLIPYQQLSQQASTAQRPQTPTGYTAFPYYSYIPYFPGYYSYDSSPYYTASLQYAQYRQYPYSSYAYA